MLKLDALELVRQRLPKVNLNPGSNWYQLFNVVYEKYEYQTKHNSETTQKGFAELWIDAEIILIAGRGLDLDVLR